MGLLNKLAKKFSHTSVSVGKGGGVPAQDDAGGLVGGSGVVEECVDYTCPTLKDVSVKGGRAMFEGGLDDGVDDAVDGKMGDVEHEECDLGMQSGGPLNDPDASRSVSADPTASDVQQIASIGRAGSVGKSEQLDMRSEMDTMSIGSASEMASEEGELAMSRFQSGVPKRDRVSRMLGELEREEASVRGAGTLHGENDRINGDKKTEGVKEKQGGDAKGTAKTSEKKEETEGSTDVCARLSALVKRYNDVAVGCMEGSSLDQSLVCLLKAEQLLEDASGKDGGGVDGLQRGDADVDKEIQRLRSITYNNLGCLYRRMAEPEKALMYLQKALTIEVTSAEPKVNELASTHLNLSASYSVLHKDVEALRHGERAIVLLQGQLWPGLSFKEGMEMLLAKVAKEGGVVPAGLMRDAHVLSMAYHNVGTQNERLGRIREAQVSFNRAVSIGTKILGPSDRMTVTLQKNNRMFLQRNGGMSKSSGLQRSRSGVGLSNPKASGTVGAKAVGGKAGSAKASAHSRTKSGLKAKK